jgi:hypothetical protein
MAIAKVSDMAGDDAVRSATGRTAGDWVELLEAAGAAGWKHAAIARWLVDEHGVDGWWAQNLTVRYEQACGRREPGQQADGTFTASSSRSAPDSETGAFDAVVAATSAELGFEPRARREHALRPNARWTLPSGETVLVAVEPSAGRIRIAVMFEKLPDSAATVGGKERAARILASGLGG